MNACLWPPVQQSRQAGLGGAVEPSAIFDRQGARKLENVMLAVALAAAMRRTPAFTWGMRVKLLAERAEHRPHATKPEAAHFRAVRKRPCRNRDAKRPASPFQQLLHALNALFPRCRPAEAPRKSALRPLVAPHLKGTLFERQGGPKADDADPDKDVPEKAWKVLVPRCFESLRRIAQAVFPRIANQFLSPPKFPVANLTGNI